MLAGGLKPSPLVEAADCSVLDLWLTQDQTVLDVWLERLADVPSTSGGSIPTHILTSPQLPVPWPDHIDPEWVSVEQEPRPLRGPAGVVADVCRRFDPDETILIVEAARCLTLDLTSMIATHEAEDAAITVACNPDLSAAGVYLARAGVFSDVPGVGFMDLKEQFLNKALDDGKRVVAHPFAGDGCMRLHTSEQFLSASLALRHGVPGRRSSRQRTSGLVPSDRRKTGSVICPGAFIGQGATVIDSIVMPGAVVEDEALVVRSLICPGSLIQTGTDIADATAGARHRMSDRSRRAA